ncbi:hypothetical protein [Virgibacillus doumboii]|uniref:hypothetical protein n=1 Tax=Virgibacillus doumboii TaxID=2697503 RepID=UPI0013DFEC96|nr:hypothetical protein [Virgibacillus doumboii]
MKKLLTLMALMLVLVLAACGQTNNDADDKNNGDGDTNASETDKAEENDDKAVKKALLNNYLDVLQTIRPLQSKINIYTGALNDPEAEAAEALKEEAITAAEEAVTAIDELTVKDLDEERTAQFNEALADLKAAYEEYTTVLAAEEVDVTAAEDKITAANDKLSSLFEEAGLNDTNLAKEIM